ncbi:beta-1 adrenergic receptor-like [Orbicella faveolata]|uniref:beta-1 adrenergic receptor-like n=1 Tax=Orbicella faveolata TaxID=48498 RepID=UPI0009E24900|nr:beta-1 adrenergic receptor-like [Orbicella faveolata]
MNFSSHSPSCNLPLGDGVFVPEWRPNFLTSKISVALILVTIVNLLVSPLTIFLNVLVIIAVKTTPQLRNKYNSLLACLAGTDIMTGALGQPLFIAELIYRLTGRPASEFCIIPHAARRLSRAFVLISLQHLAFISIERYISIKFPFKYDNIVTKRRLIVSVVLAWSLVFLAILFPFYKLSVLNSLYHVFAIFLAIFILVFCRIASYHEARKRMREITTQSARAKFLKAKKALKTTSFVIGLVLLCYLPMALFRIFLGSFISSPDAFLAVESLMLTFALCNSGFNPVIYCARSRQYRRAFKKRLCRANYVQPI